MFKTIPGFESHKNIFQLTLLVSTISPLLFFILFIHVKPPDLALNTANYILLFLAVGHVPSTFALYTIKDFKEIISKNKIRYLYIPIILFFISGLIFSFSNDYIKPYLLLFYWIWQSYHYGKQNIGVYSFISIAQNKPAGKLEKAVINFGTFAGIIATWKILGFDVAPKYLHQIINNLFFFGQILFGLIFVLIIYTLTAKTSKFTLTKATFFILLTLFFLPIYFSPQNILVNFFSYAVAHAIQYIIFMTIIALYESQTKYIGKKDSGISSDLLKISDIKPLITLTLFLILGGFLFYHTNEIKAITIISKSLILSQCVDFLLGGFLGLTMAHFIVDAHAWKLSSQDQKLFMLKRFKFIFEK